jgi:anti-sigma regulatory factor (Ser/Thr protein kinase)
VLEYTELGADPSALSGVAARGRGAASLVLLAAAIPEGVAPTLRIIVHDAIVEAPAIIAAARDPGPPVPLVPPVPARDARRIRDLLRTRGVEAEVVRADRWRRAIVVCGSSFEDVAEAVARSEGFAARAGVPHEESLAFLAALREAAANAAHHGNRDDPARLIRIDVVAREEALAISVEDEGVGFDHAAVLREIDAAQDSVERATGRLAAGGHGGLGLVMIRRWADEVSWENGGRRIRIQKRFR